MYLLSPTPDVSLAITPELEILLDKLVGVVLPVLELPKATIALSPPYPLPAKPVLWVPTPVVSLATTPVFDTKLERSAILSLPR